MKKSSIFKKILAVVCLWLAVLIGGTLLLNLLNLLTPRDMRFQPGGLGYYIMGILSGPVGVYLGQHAMEFFTEGKEYIFRAVNYTVVAVFVCCVAIFSTLLNGVDIYYLLLEIATAIMAGVCAAGDFKRQAEDVNNG